MPSHSALTGGGTEWGDKIVPGKNKQVEGRVFKISRNPDKARNPGGERWEQQVQSGEPPFRDALGRLKSAETRT